MSYEDTGQFEVAVGQLADPLNDPLPGRPPAVEEPPAGSPWFRAPEMTPEPAAPAPPREPKAQQAPQAQPQPRVQAQPQVQAQHAQPRVQPQPQVQAQPQVPAEPRPRHRHAAPDETARLPVFEPQPERDPEPGRGPAPTPAPAPEPPPDPAAGPGAGPDLQAGPVAAASAAAGPVPSPQTEAGGRAARRKAAARAGGHRARARTPAAAPATGGQETSAPLSRVEARRAAKAAKDSPAVVISRIVGELFITLGVIMLLFVTYQLWWTNVRAHAQASSTSNNLEHQWDSDRSEPSAAPGTFSPGQGFAIMYIPKLDVKAPIAQGVDTEKVLNKGMVGHYDGALNTAMPWDKTGNFAVAAHRNTHGEPFRYINHLTQGDKVVVETASTYYTYTVTSTLASTPPSNTSVIEPVPPGSGFTKPGRYITLTTCTPEFTSTNRLIVWGKLTEERPRSKGKPAALANG
jgi:sortase A